MTESWMELLMDRTVAKGQTVDDLLRRSAGIPAAFIALFLAEPEGTPKKLLPRALEWLIEFAKTSLANFQKDINQKSEVMKDDLGELCESQSGTAVSIHSNGNLSKIRDEGVVPTVHVFNVLRAAFNDANLATDTSGFSAEATIVAIHAFSSPYWEVRNAACLAYTALVRRMVGFLNVQKRESARRSLTGLEFFHRQVHNIIMVHSMVTLVIGMLYGVALLFVKDMIFLCCSIKALPFPSSALQSVFFLT